ncbi:MAG: DUF374 domain-containing protein [Epsilonproteobacteria bacterium]|nr:DUF374 domain-containing protein [Campylobacterota bacterium]
MTYRVRFRYAQAVKQPLANQEGLFYFWHQHIASGMFFFWSMKARGHCVVSPSSDGKFAGFVCKKLGFDVLYGSAHKSSFSLVRNALQVLKKDKHLCLVGDGSRGPAFKLQKGVKYLAARTKVPLIYVECKPSAAYVFKKSWDQFKLPLPFSTIEVYVHAPQHISLDDLARDEEA